MQGLMSVESSHSGQTLQPDAYPVGAVRYIGRKPEHHQYRQSQVGASSGDGIDAAGKEAGQAKQGDCARIKLNSQNVSTL